MRKEMNSEELRLESTECKRSEGITLIALIITIIILITLAVVSVRIVVNQNIFQHAERGAELYTVEQEKELIGIGYSEYKMKKYISEEDSQDNPEIQKLSKYFLSLSAEDIEAGENEDGSYYYKFKSNDIINDAETSIVVIGMSVPSTQEQCLGNRSSGFIIKYNNNVYISNIGENGFTGEVEFNSTTLNLTENKEEQKLLNSYFTLNSFDEIYDDYTSKFKGDNNTIPDAETSIIRIGLDMTGIDHIIQYKDRIYKIDITKAATCHDHDTYNGLELISMTNTTGNNQLQVKDANVEGDEEYGWTITFNGTGNQYTLDSKGKIDPKKDEDIDVGNWWELSEEERAQLVTYNEQLLIAAKSDFSECVTLATQLFTDFGQEVIIVWPSEQPSGDPIIMYIFFQNDFDFQKPNGESVYHFEKQKWYLLTDGSNFNQDTMFEYTGESPIKMTDFKENEIFCKSYLERIIASF